MTNDSSVFEYMYRDGGNFKTFGQFRLEGWSEQAEEAIRRCLESGNVFVSEQIGVPSLCVEHWQSVDDGPSDLDHAFHEFLALRPATDDDASLPLWGRLDALLKRMQAAAGRWDVRLSPNCDL